MKLLDHIYSKRALITGLGMISAGCFGSTLSAAEPTGGNVEEQEITRELKAFEDPTILIRRAWLETEWNKYRDGRHDIEETLGALYAWGVSSNQDWAVRLKVPYKWHIAGDAVDDSDRNGLGDIQVATGTAFRLSQSWRAAGGLELRLPTGQNGLSDNVYRIQEFGSAAWDVNRWLTLSPSLEYNQSIAELHGAAPNHYLEMYFPAIFLLPHRWSITPRYEGKVDFQNDNYYTHSAKLVAFKELEWLPLGITLSIKRSFDSGVKEFTANFALTYFFR